jgi:hypothetical protein
MVDRTKEIKKELAELNDCLKMSVQKAIMIGCLLLEQKEFVGHGNFIKWSETNLDISYDNVDRLIKRYIYQDKIRNLRNLQEADETIKQLEYQEKKLKEQEDNKIIFEYKRTGIKPEGWERRHEYIYKKCLDDAEYENRKQNIFENKNKEQLKKEDERKKEFEKSIKEDDDLIDQLRNEISISKEDEKIKETLRLNNREDNLSQEIIFETLDDYIESIDSNSRKIETAQNIIKYLRNKIVIFQRK